MNISLDLYAPDYVSGGDANFITTLEHSANNPMHLLHYLIGVTGENDDYIIRNIQVWG